jgi:hypothetical protein
MSGSKMLLLFTGPWHGSYTSAQCQNIINNSGANEFVILSAYGFNYCQSNDYILTESYVRSTTDVPNSYFGATDATSISTIRQQMVDAINKYNNYNTNTYNYTTFVTQAVALAEQLIAIQGSCKIWFGCPTVIENCYTAAIRYNYYNLNYFFTPIKTQMTANGHWGNVEGFYYGTESVQQWYTAFNTNAISNQFDNPVVKNMKDLSDHVKNSEKKMLWIPYYHDSEGYVDALRDGYVINRTNIFDKALLQPMYYFSPNQGISNLTLISNCISSQACKLDNGTIVSGSKTSSTEIGVEMEVDTKIITGGTAGTAQEYLNRYNSYVTAFSAYVGSRPIAYYAGGPSEVNNATVFSKINSFYN